MIASKILALIEQHELVEQREPQQDQRDPVTARGVVHQARRTRVEVGEAVALRAASGRTAARRRDRILQQRPGCRQRQVEHLGPQPAAQAAIGLAREVFSFCGTLKTLISPSWNSPRRLRFAEPMPTKTSSTIIIFACT